MNAVRTVLLCTLAATLAACVASQPRNAANLCSMFEDRRSWYRAARKSEQHWGVPLSVSMAMLYQESAFRARVRPERTRILWVLPGPRPSTAVGYAQALDSTWSDYQRATGKQRASRSDFADAVDFVGWYNAMSMRVNGIAPADAHNLYLAYHEGNSGFARRSYADKGWLLAAAANVQANADRFSRQYAGCRNSLEQNWFMRLFF